MKPGLTCLCAAVLLLAPQPVRATSFALLLTSGIDGECEDPAFPNWIELTSLGLSGPLIGGAPGGFLIHKRFDKASPLLARQCASGKHIKEAKLVLRRTTPAPNSPPLICVVTMSDLLVTDVSSTLAEAVGEPFESVTLKFSRIHFRYFAQDGSESITSLSLGQGGADGDGDGIPDAWESYYGFATDLDSAKDDPDRDGLTNLQEFGLGTNPLSGESRFEAVVSPVPGDPSQIDLSWDSVPGVAYVIEWSEDLQTYVPLGGNRVADSSSMKVRIPRTGATGFFRVRPADT